MSSSPEWEKIGGFPCCGCATNAAALPSVLGPGLPTACNHLYVKKPAHLKGIFDVSISEATSTGTPEDCERPQGVRVMRGGPMTIVIHPTPPWPNNERPRSEQSSGPAFASLADERAADDLGVLLMGQHQSRANSPTAWKRRSMPKARRCKASSAESRSRRNCPMQSVTVKMPSRAFEVDIKLEKILKDSAASTPKLQASNTCRLGPSDDDEGKENSIRCYKHTISSLISSRLVDMIKESKMLEESECRRKGAHRPRRQLPPALPPSAYSNGGLSKCMYDTFSKQMKQRPRQFSFH